MIYLTLIVVLFSLQASNQVEIRIANQSRVTLEDVRVEFASQTESYGTVEAGKETEYRVVSRAYRYARIEALVDGKPALLQPIDYVGEKELKPGRYTYVLKINQKASSEYDLLILECRKD